MKSFILGILAICFFVICGGVIADEVLTKKDGNTMTITDNTPTIRDTTYEEVFSRKQLLQATRADLVNQIAAVEAEIAEAEGYLTEMGKLGIKELPPEP